MRDRHRAARAQDLGDDDRKHLQWCLYIIRDCLITKRDARTLVVAHAALDFVVALLDRDYGLELNARTKDDRAEALRERLDGATSERLPTPHR